MGVGEADQEVMSPSSFLIEKISDKSCQSALDWLDASTEPDRTLLIDSFGGTSTPLFYQLVEKAELSVSVTAIAKRAHSCAAILFLAFSKRQIYSTGEILFKPQNIEMTLKRASLLASGDLARYAAEYERYSLLLERLLKTRSIVRSEEIALILEEEAMLLFDAGNALKAGLAQSVLYTTLASGNSSDAASPLVVHQEAIYSDIERITV